MGREIRRVPKDWKHPLIGETGYYQPLLGQTYLECVVEHVHSLPWYLWPRNWRYLKEWFEGFPDKAYCQPRWRQEPVCYQVYETVSEGTPTSPVFETLDELVEWIVTAKGHSRDVAEAFAKQGWVPSFIIGGGKVYSNIECAKMD